jgi:outer membrane protein assembly factor BamB
MKTKNFLGVVALVLCILGSSPLLAQVDGTVKWGYETGNPVYSSPAIGADGTIYVGSTDFNLHAINPNGTLKWKYATGNEIVSSPAIGVDGTIYVGSYDGYLYAVNPDGILKWKYQTADVIECSPAIGVDGTIYLGSYNGSFHAINPDGTQKWIFNPGYGQPFAWTSPAIGSDGTIYTVSYDGNLYAINPNGTVRWQFPAILFWSPSPAIGADGTIYAGCYLNYIHAINPDGTLKWKFTTGGPMQSSPAIGTDGTIYIGSDDHNLYAIKPDGTLKWQYQTGGAIKVSAAIGADGTIFVGSYDANFYAINPDGTLKWTHAFTGYANTFSSPAIGTDGTVYVEGDASYIYALSSSCGGLANTPWPKYHHDSQGTGRVVVNRAPVAICQDIRKPAGIGCQADAAAQDFDNGSYDPDGDPLTYAISPVGPYPLGDTLVTLTVTDTHNAEASCSAKITVYDDTPPIITSLAANPNSLWPANHKMVPVSITISAIDSCSPTVTSQIIDVTSNEPVDGLGDGDTAPDWLITGPLTLNLRAERSGNGAGRIYTITIECRDAAGNKATGIVTVKVPKSLGK